MGVKAAGPESYLVWLKRKIERNHGTGLINLATSGLRLAEVNRWMDGICERQAALADRMSNLNEFGLQGLKDGIRYSYGISSEREVVLTSGASGGFRFVCEMLLAGSSDAEVIVESPVYEPLILLPARFGAKISCIDRGWDAADEFVDAVREKLRSETRAVILSNPHNPSGNWLSRDAVGRLASAVQTASPNCALIIDEAFNDLGPSSGATASDIAPCIITINSLSKSYGLGGLRCGWVVADRRQFPELLNDWVLFESIGSKLLEAIDAIAFLELAHFRDAAMLHIARNRDIVSTWFKEMVTSGLLRGHLSPHGCLLFPQVPDVVSVDALVERLEREHGVLVTPGHFFGTSFGDHIRIGFGGDSVGVIEGLTRLAQGLRAAATCS